MRRTAVILALCLCAKSVFAQDTDTLKTFSVEEIVVTAQRSLRDIGVQKTPLGGEVLQTDIAVSMADVLAQSSAIFIKSSGRSTLSTASLRGTAPSHTAVSWNGIGLGSPMLGMVDFSMIPSYFVDSGDVYHGATSVSVIAGGLGGAVVLSTAQNHADGLGLQYIQNIASFGSYDEFLRITYGGNRWRFSTRALHSSAENDFPYVNYDKVGHPNERNRNCGYADSHLLQEVFYNPASGGELAFRLWITDSHRGIPKLSVDYRDDDLTRAWQNEKSLRSAVGWNKAFGAIRLDAKAGYNYNDLNYIYQYSLGDGSAQRGVDSKSYTHNIFAETAAEWSIGNTLMLAADLKAERFAVASHDYAPLTPVGYDASRQEVSGFASVRWKPTEHFGAALNLREELRDGVFSPLIPALFIDYSLPSAGVVFSMSAARNYRYPSLNDLCFVPGGNPDLRPERGYTLDGGAEWALKKRGFEADCKVTGFYSLVEDWILWNPTVKGFWTPANLNRVESYGVESRAAVHAFWGRDWRADITGLFGITRSENKTEGDSSYRRQLPYIPVYSASVTASASWRRWQFCYRWNYYSERNTSYSGTSFTSGSVPAYFMNDVSLGRNFSLKRAKIKVRFDINNLFDEEYQSVLSRPMPPRNYALAVEVDFGTLK